MIKSNITDWIQFYLFRFFIVSFLFADLFFYYFRTISKESNEILIFFQFICDWNMNVRSRKINSTKCLLFRICFAFSFFLGLALLFLSLICFLFHFIFQSVSSRYTEMPHPLTIKWESLTSLKQY